MEVTDEKIRIRISCTDPDPKPCTDLDPKPYQTVMDPELCLNYCPQNPDVERGGEGGVTLPPPITTTTFPS